MFGDHIFQVRDLRYILYIIAIFVAIFLLMRIFNVYRKRSCPSCTGRLTRKQRSMGDKLARIITLGILPFRRYKCVHCGWEGLRWNIRKEQRKEPRP